MDQRRGLERYVFALSARIMRRILVDACGWRIPKC
jgi:hypothetical protein